MLPYRDLNTLEKSFLFRGCSHDEIESLLARCSYSMVTCKKNELLFTPEHFRHELGILLTGRVRVIKGDGLIVSELTAGDLFGAAALFNSEEDYVSTLTARSDCRVLFLTQADVQGLINRSQTVRWNYIGYLSQRIRFLSSKVDALVQGSGERKLSRFLLANMAEDGTVLLPCSMVELAQRLNLGRTSLYRELLHMQEQGILHREGKIITIVKPELLSE